MAITFLIRSGRPGRASGARTWDRVLTPTSVWCGVAAHEKKRKFVCPNMAPPQLTSIEGVGIGGGEQEPLQHNSPPSPLQVPGAVFEGFSGFSQVEVDRVFR